MRDKVNLATRSYPCNLAHPLCEDVVLIHGWGCASQTWQPLIPFLQNVSTVTTMDLPGFGESEEISAFTLDSVMELISTLLPQKCVLIGWSLGGMIATQMAARYPQQISRLITLATNVKFVASRDYETAMPLVVNQQFNNSFVENSAATLKLFSGLLAQGDVNERLMLKQMRSLIQTEKTNSNWREALDLLAALDNRTIFANLTQPGLHLLAEKDALVPAAATYSLQALNPQQQIHLVPHSSHAMHWSQPDSVAQLIKHFLHRPVFEKKQVAQSFSRAAATYDSVASLQREAGDKLLKKIGSAPSTSIVIDLGCGTGYFTPQLQHFFPKALIVGIDIAEGMLQFAKKQHFHSKNWVCSDAEALPFANQSVDIIYSNFALQWCTNLPRLFSELYSVLKPGGELIFTTLGPKTLHELKSAWQQVDNRTHVNQFHEQEELISVLGQQGFNNIELECHPVIMEFEQLSELRHSLKALGAQNINPGRAVGLAGRSAVQTFKQAYENFRRNNLLPATYDIFYLKAKR